MTHDKDNINEQTRSCMKKKNRNLLTEDQKAFLLKHYKGITTIELTALINEKFGLNLTCAQIRHYLYNHKLKNGVNTRFKQGYTPHNKGKKWGEYMPPEARANARKTTFQKGHIPHNHRPIGSERLDKDGYTLVKVAEPKKWELKHRLIYEKAYGPIPKGKKVIFLDGNKQNFDLDNLVLVTPAEMLVLNKHGLISGEPEITKTSITLAKVMLKNTEVSKKYQKRSDRK